MKGGSLAILVVLVAVSGCGDDDTPPAAGTTGGETDAGTTSASSTPTSVSPTAGSSSSGDLESSDGTDSTGELEPTVRLQLLALNDFHGQLEPPPPGPASEIWTGKELVVTGGVAYLADDVDRLRSEAEHTIVVSAGDLIGGSPLTSALLHDEPTIEAMNLLGLDVAGVGNHEFDDGVDELLRMQAGGCHPDDGCVAFDPFVGAQFEFLAANVVYEATDDTIFPAVAIRDVDGVSVAFIGMTLENTAETVIATSAEGLEFRDEIETVEALLPGLQEQGIEAFVLLLHEGLSHAGIYSDCVSPGGVLVAIAEGMPDAIDVIVSGHTHQAYVCDIGGKLVTSGASQGKLITDIDIEIDRASGDVIAAEAVNVLVERDDTNPELATHVDAMVELVAPIANAQVGTITEDIGRTQGPTGQCALGRLVADAQVAAVSDVSLGGAQLGLMNYGGLRADLLFAASGEEAKDGIVTYGELAAVHPFGNTVTTMTLTGQQLHDVLEGQWQRDGTRILLVSAGFTYEYSASAPVGDKVDPASMMLNDNPIALDDEVRVAVNDFVATGGGPFTGFDVGTDVLGGPVDVEALVAYFEQGSPFSAPTSDGVVEIP